MRFEPHTLPLAPCLRLAMIIMMLHSIHSSAAAQPVHSQLWGEAGELWQPESRLPDFSHAGYRRGEAPLPQVPVVANVRDFGATGDGETDDSAAIKRAIAEAGEGAIFFPPGRYLITDILEITRGNIVLRGAGPDQTVLYFPTPLNDIRPNMGATTGGQPTSNYSWSGGFVWVRGNYGSSDLAEITAPARRGDTTLTVSTTDRLTIGQNIEIFQQDDQENSLAAHLYAGDPGGMAQLRARTRVSLVARITAIDGQRITLDRPLRFDIEQRWQPKVRRFQPTVTDVGIEHMSFEFPVQPYAGHFTELGHNAIAFTQVADCWARDIVINHSDSGLFVAARFCTVDGVIFNSDRPPDRGGNTGHHGIYISGDDNLFTRFQFNTRFIHDITVSHCAGNVISAGRGVDLCFDHHKRAPYANLFTDIDLGAGARMYRSGGGADLGRHSAAWTTFWNIRAQRPQSWPPGNFAPDLINFVGVHTQEQPQTSERGRWIEPIDPAALAPSNLHEAQLRRRLQAR
jgi:hypothetical protein